MELLLAVQRLVQQVQVRFKHTLACRRPVEYSSQIQPVIPTPGHGALPAGHAAEAFAMAIVLIAITGGKVPQLPSQAIALAHRVAQNRVVAGVHFPVDLIAGAILGLVLGAYFVTRATGHPQAAMGAWSFVGEDSSLETRDLEIGHFYDIAGGTLIQQGYLQPWGTGTVLGEVSSPILAHLWTRGVQEWP